MTEIHDYAPHMVNLYRAYKSLDVMLRDKRPAHDCQKELVAIMREAARVAEYLKERG